MSLDNGERTSRSKPARSSLEEIHLEIPMEDLLLQENKKNRKSKKRSVKRGSNYPASIETKISTTDSIQSTGDAHCDKLIAQMNNGEVRKLDELYTLKEKLGEGAFAKVYLAIHKESGKRMALKIMSLDKNTIEEEIRERSQGMIGGKESVEKIIKKKVMWKFKQMVESIDKEIHIMRLVADFKPKNRRGLVTISDVFATNDQVIFAMELLSGGDLFERVSAKTSFSERDAALMMRRIMKGIKVLHDNRIVHRDLKPENLVFENNDEDSKIKITDFGLAFKLGEPDIFDYTIVGSAAYIAPEILQSKYYSTACDIWAMGCILFILLVGGPPFSGKDDTELFNCIKKGEYEYPEDCQISEKAKDLIAKMLDLNPRTRVTAQQVLNHPWLKSNANSAELISSMNHLRAFNTRRKLKEWALAMVVSSKNGRAKILKEILLNTSKEDGFTGEELIDLREILFEVADAKREVDFGRFKEAFDKMGITDIPMERMFEAFAKKKESCSAADICVGLSTMAKKWRGQDALRYCFDTYDRDGQGKISKNDVQKILKVVMGEDRFDKVSSGMNGLFNSIWRRSPKVSFKDFSDAVVKQGGDYNFKKRVLSPMATWVKSMSKAGYTRASRIGSNVSTLKTSITRFGWSGSGFINEEASGKISKQGSYVSNPMRGSTKISRVGLLKQNQYGSAETLQNKRVGGSHNIGRSRTGESAFTFGYSDGATRYTEDDEQSQLLDYEEKSFRIRNGSSFTYNAEERKGPINDDQVSNLLVQLNNAGSFAENTQKGGSMPRLPRQGDSFRMNEDLLKQVNNGGKVTVKTEASQPQKKNFMSRLMVNPLARGKKTKKLEPRKKVSITKKATSPIAQQKMVQNEMVEQFGNLQNFIHHKQRLSNPNISNPVMRDRPNRRARLIREQSIPERKLSEEKKKSNLYVKDDAVEEEFDDSIEGRRLEKEKRASDRKSRGFQDLEFDDPRSSLMARIKSKSRRSRNIGAEKIANKSSQKEEEVEV